MTKKEQTPAVELTDLDFVREVRGGGLLLPAVQKVRDVRYA